MRSIAIGAAEFDQQPAFARRHELDVVRVQSDRFHVADQTIVDAFEPDRFAREDFGDVIARGVDVRITEHQERAGGRTVDEANARAENDNARALGADQRTRDVESVLRQ